MKRWIPPLFRIGLLGLCAVGVAAEVTHDFESRITHVAVHGGCARVERSGEVDLPKGPSALVIRGLPAWVDPSSILARVSAADKASVQGARAETAKDTEKAKEELEQTQDAVAAVEAKITDKEQEIDALKSQREHVDKLMPWHVGKLPREAKERPVTAAELKEVNDYLLQARMETVAKIAEANKELRALKDELEKAQEQLERVKQRVEEAQTELVVHLLADEPTKATVRVSYLIAGASWYPEYSASVKPGSDVLQLAIHGVVQQATGEDWENVSVTLAAPLPDAPPERVGPCCEPKQMRWKKNMPEQAQVPQIEPPYPFVPQLSAFIEQWQKAGESRDDRRAAIWRVANNMRRARQAFRTARLWGTTVRWEGASPVTMQSDGQAGMVTAGQIEFLVEFRYRAIPAVSRKATATGVAANNSEHALLPGVVGVLRDGRLVERSKTGLVPRGGRLSLELGSTDQVRAERIFDLENSHMEEIGTRTRLLVAYRIKLTSKLSGPARVEVVDQLPTSRERTAQVRLHDSNPRGSIGEAGKITWDLEVKDNEPLELTYSFELEYPSGRPPAHWAVFEQQLREKKNAR